MTILNTIENAGKKLLDNLSDLHLHLNYGLEVYPETDLWYDTITNTTAPAVNKVLNAGEKIKDAVLSVPKYLKYILIGAGVLAIGYVVFKIVKK